MKQVCWIGMVLWVVLVFAGCAHNGPQRSYPAGSMGSAMQVQRGEVLAVAMVTVDGRHSALGTWGGAVVGNSIGRSAGGGSRRHVAGAMGAVGGAIAGRALERAATTRTAVEVLVALDNGQVIAILQEDDQTLRPGDRVRVLRGRRFNQVVPI